MDTLEYLQALYNGLSSGALSVTAKVGASMLTKWFSPDQLEQMALFAQKCGTKYNTYIGISPREKSLGKNSRGQKEDVGWLVTLFADYDVKGPAHKETRLPESREELLTFLNSLPIPISLAVDSGNGVHAYWLLKTPYRTDTDELRDKAEACIKGWERFINDRAMREHGWRFDAVCDLPRMLRAPGTTNFKTEDHPCCQVIHSSDIRYDLTDFEPYAIVGNPPPAKTVPVDTADAFAMMGSGSAQELMDGCEFLQHCRDDAQNLPEPIWHAAITNLALTSDGQEMIHEISRPYPGYSYAETQKKFENAVKANKPHTCKYIQEHLGFRCGRDCGVKAPIALLRKGQKGPVVWEQPIPFDEISLPDFPVDALPDAIADYVNAVAESTQTPPDMAATAALAIVALTMQGKYKVRGKDDWVEPVNLYAVNVAEPAERKSAVISLMTRFMSEYEAEYNKQMSAKLEVNQMAKRVLERKKAAIIEKVSKGKADETELQEVGEEIANFAELHPLRLYTDDVTTEKLTSILADNGGVAGLVSAEGGIFDLLAGIYSKNVNIDVFLKAHAGDSLRVDRIGRSSETIQHPALTVLLAVQPSVLSGMMQNSTFRGRGLTARFLYCMPTSKVGARKYRSEAIPAEVATTYEFVIRDLLEEEAREAPQIIPLSAEADKLLEEFANELEPKLREEYSDISDWAGKLTGAVLRISALLCRSSVMVSNPFEMDSADLVVSGETMANAIRIGRYYLEHARAAYSLMGADPAVKQCKYVLAAISKYGLTEVNRRDIMRICRSFKTAEEVQPVLNRLAEYGYLAVKDDGNYATGGRPANPTYLVNPAVLTG